LLHFLNSHFKDHNIMLTSARNQFLGTVTAIDRGAVNSEVSLNVDGLELTAVITNRSVETLGLAPGSAAYALIKAPSVIVLTDSSIKTSARNQIWGTVSRCAPGAVNAIVSITADSGPEITASITLDSLNSLGLAAGVRACALIKASQIILATKS
jgi:molybdate transport system regulatory protein